MKKLLGLLLVLALVVPAKADILKNLKSTGEIQVIGDSVNREFMGPGGSYSNITLRVLYGLNFDLAEDVKANLTMAYYNMWGQNTGSSYMGINHTGRSLQDYLNEVDLIEANVVLSNLFDCLEAKVGRQFYGDEDSAIIYLGPNHYNTRQLDYRQAKSVDAAVISYAGEMVSWGFIYSKVNELDTAANLDATILGLDVKANVNDNFKAQGYFYNFRNDDSSSFSSGTTEKYLGIYGAKGTFNADIFTLSAEYARNVGGEDAFDHDKGSLLKIDASVDLGAFTPRGTIVRAENFRSYGNYRPGIIVGQEINNNAIMTQDFFFEDIFVGNLGVDMKFAALDKFVFSIDGFAFNDRNIKDSTSYEANAMAKYNMNPNVELHVAVGGFHEHSIDNVYKAQGGMLIRF